jgi:hypothetical protein
MTPLFDKKQLFLVILRHIGIALLSIAVAALIGTFLARHIERIAHSLTEQRRLELLLEKRVEITQSMNDNVLLVAENEAKIRAALLPVDNILQFVGMLESVANENSLKQEVHFGVPVAYDTPEEPMLHAASIDYTASIHGNIFVLANYLKAIEQLPYFAGVNSFTLNASGAEGWRSDSAINLRAKVYVTNPQ